MEQEEDGRGEGKTEEGEKTVVYKIIMGTVSSTPIRTAFSGHRIFLLRTWPGDPFLGYIQGRVTTWQWEKL